MVTLSCRGLDFSVVTVPTLHGPAWMILGRLVLLAEETGESLDERAKKIVDAIPQRLLDRICLADATILLTR